MHAHDLHDEHDHDRDDHDRDASHLRVVTDDTSTEHAHEWRWTASGRVPGVSGSRWMAYRCDCGAVERRSA